MKRLNFISLFSGGGIADIGAKAAGFELAAAMPRQPARAWLDSGRVIRITPRDLARFQSIPDSYILPDNDTLACKIVGNGVPSLMYEIIARSFMDFHEATRQPL